MPFKRQTPEQIAYAKSKQQEYSARYRVSAKGRKAKVAGQARYYEAHKDDINTRNRAACSVCGGPKEPGRGFKKCNACWGVRPEKDLEQLIKEQEGDLFLGEFQPPQRFGDSNAPGRSTLPIDWRDDIPDDIWADPTADEALNEI